MKDIAGFENLYAITEDGKVWSYRSRKFLSPCIGDNGYYRVNLRKDCKGFSFLVHRLVAEAYIPNPNNYETVDHIDGNKSNNCVENLQWMGRGNNVRKTSGYKVQNIETGEIYDSLRNAAEATGKSRVTITKHCNGKVKTPKFKFYNEVN